MIINQAIAQVTFSHALPLDNLRPEEPEMVAMFAEIGKIIASSDLEDSQLIDDLDILEEVRSLLEGQVGRIKRVNWLVSRDNKLQGQAEQAISIVKSQYYAFTLLQEGKMSYQITNPKTAAEFGEYDYAEKGVKLNCRPGNMQCGGKCQKGTQKCNVTLGQKAKQAIASIFEKVKAFIDKFRGASREEKAIFPSGNISHHDLIDSGAKLIPKELKSHLDNNIAPLTKQIFQLGSQLKAASKGEKRDKLVQEHILAYEKWMTGYDKAVSLMTDFRRSLINGASVEDKKAAKKFIQNLVVEDLDKDLRKDVIAFAREFGTLTGGKGTSTLRYMVQTAERAHASKELKEVNLGDEPQKGTTFHEMGHHIEYENPELAKAALDWVKERATSMKPQKINKLEKTTLYDKDEVAYPDHFIAPYVGKVYKDLSTEVISMGVERFSDPDTMVNFYLKDPAHFCFTMGALQHRGS